MFATKDFSRGDFVLDYAGEVLDQSVADKLIEQTYVYYFQIGSRHYRYEHYSLLHIVEIMSVTLLVN